MYVCMYVCMHVYVYVCMYRTFTRQEQSTSTGLQNTGQARGVGDRTVQERPRQDRIGQDRTRLDWTGRPKAQDRTAQDTTAPARAGAGWIGEQGTLHDTTAQGIYVCVCTRACTRECTYVCDGICVPQVAFRTKFVATHVAESFAQASE